MIEMPPIFLKKMTKIPWNLKYNINTLKHKKITKIPQKPRKWPKYP